MIQQFGGDLLGSKSQTSILRYQSELGQPVEKNKDCKNIQNNTKSKICLLLLNRV